MVFPKSIKLKRVLLFINIKLINKSQSYKKLQENQLQYLVTH